jgi:hypothetical protein
MKVHLKNPSVYAINRDGNLVLIKSFVNDSFDYKIQEDTVFVRIPYIGIYHPIIESIEEFNKMKEESEKQETQQ